VRRVCTEAALALVGLIEQHAGDSPTTQAKQAEAKQAEAKQTEAKQTEAKQTEAKQAYARAMPQCERWMDFAPLVTVFRTSD
jgi:topoisomerase IA-like protein